MSSCALLIWQIYPMRMHTKFDCFDAGIRAIYFQSGARYPILAGMTTKIIYLIVGGKVRATPARIIGKLAEVDTPYGIREFGVYFLTEADAQRALQAKSCAAHRR